MRQRYSVYRITNNSMGHMDWTREQIDLIKSTVAKELLIRSCGCSFTAKKTGLDPLTKSRYIA